MYKRNAGKLCEELKTAFPDIQVEVNPKKPRSKSFEVMLCKDDGTGSMKRQHEISNYKVS